MSPSTSTEIEEPNASTLTTNAAGQAQAVVANVADPSAGCFGACGFP
jgi:hypothetical protein